MKEIERIVLGGHVVLFHSQESGFIGSEDWIKKFGLKFLPSSVRLTEFLMEDRKSPTRRHFANVMQRSKLFQEDDMIISLMHPLVKTDDNVFHCERIMAIVSTRKNQPATMHLLFSEKETPALADSLACRNSSLYNKFTSAVVIVTGDDADSTILSDLS